ncbi:MAG TPA: hypothetical protein VFQ72_04115 [Candidatus Paceibacterota bacterium]|nr:hypothetical protein [Candidatus Paceibacterota bacterium]
MNFINAVNSQSSFAPRVSRDTAEKIIDSKVVSGLFSTALGERFTPARREAAIYALYTNSKSPLFYIRGAIAFGVVALERYLPHFLTAGFALALSSTYSFGPGLVYGLVSGPHASYGEFMTRSMLATILLFHLGVLFVYFALREAKARPVAASIASTALLFSLSISSYGYHLGSTIWNFATTAFFLWFALRQYRTMPAEKSLRTISWVTGVLVFFNYLIVFCWAAFLAAHCVRAWREMPGKSALGRIALLLKSQWLALVLMFLCALFFFPPGQSNKGMIVSLFEAFSFPYHIALNMFSLFNKSVVADIVQFAIAVVLVGAGIWSLKKDEKGERAAARPFLFSLGSIFLAVFVAGLFGLGLSFGPSRHVLFIAPLFFVYAGLGVDALLDRYERARMLAPAVLISLAAFGFWSLAERMAETVDKTGLIQSDGAQHILVEGCSFQLLYKDWGRGKTASMITTEKQDFRPGEAYLYVSQENGQSKGIYAQATAAGRLANWTKQGYELSIAQIQELNTGIQFLGYSPEHYPWDRQSGFVSVLFKVLKAPASP